MHYLGILGPSRPLGIQGEIESFNAKFPSVSEPVSHFPSPLTPQPHWGMFLDVSALRMDPPTSCGPDCSPPPPPTLHTSPAAGLGAGSAFPVSPGKQAVLCNCQRLGSPTILQQTGTLESSQVVAELTGLQVKVLLIPPPNKLGCHLLGFQGKREKV